MVAGSFQLNNCICKQNYKMATGRRNKTENLWLRGGGQRRLENKRGLLNGVLRSQTGEDRADAGLPEVRRSSYLGQ